MRPYIIYVALLPGTRPWILSIPPPCMVPLRPCLSQRVLSILSFVVHRSPITRLLAMTPCTNFPGTVKATSYGLYFSSTPPLPTGTVSLPYYASKCVYCRLIFLSRRSPPFQFHTEQCGDCLLDAFECVMFVWGEACPPCAISCAECTFTNRFLFLETLSSYRDAQCALLGTS